MCAFRYHQLLLLLIQLWPYAYNYHVNAWNKLIRGLDMRFLYEVISKHAFHEITMHLSITCTPPTTPPPCYTGELTGASPQG